MKCNFTTMVYELLASPIRSKTTFYGIQRCDPLKKKPKKEQKFTIE